MSMVQEIHTAAYHAQAEIDKNMAQLTAYSNEMKSIESKLHAVTEGSSTGIDTKTLNQLRETINTVNKTINTLMIAKQKLDVIKRI